LGEQSVPAATAFAEKSMIKELNAEKFYKISEIINFKITTQEDS